MKSKIYDDTFYRNRDAETSRAAKAILGIVLREFDVTSAVDFGCGIGTWLKVFKSFKGDDTAVLGLDGDYVPEKYRVIRETEFQAADLSAKIPLTRRFDLAISLEVAEHLPEARAEGFVEDLCNAADVVLFSAATSEQGGDGHVNEQRLSYWVELFAQRGYSALDIIRPQIWNDTNIPVWYRQNIMLFVNDKVVELSDSLKAYKALKWGGVIDVIHPEIFEQRSRIALHPIVKFMYRIRAFFVNFPRKS